MNWIRIAMMVLALAGVVAPSASAKSRIYINPVYFYSVTLPKGAKLCLPDNPFNAHGASIAPRPNKACEKLGDDDPQVFVSAKYNFAEDWGLPPDLMAIARHTCRQSEKHQSPPILDESPVRIAGLPTFICREVIIENGRSYRYTSLLAYRDASPYPQSDFLVWVSASPEKIEQAERDLFDIARRIQLRPYDR